MGTLMSEQKNGQTEFQSRMINPGEFEPYLNQRLLDDTYPASMLLKVLKKKIVRKISGGQFKDMEIGGVYNGLVVFDRQDLNGGGPALAMNICRILLELGFSRVEKIYELCSGPAYMAYSLLANGFCEKITLADINPAAVEVAKYTAKYNGVEDKVNIYLSDVLDQMPESEQFDIVISNPPNALPNAATDTDIRAFDPDWILHKKFYASIKRHMKPGGHVVMIEIVPGSTTDIFRPMIEAGGGTLISDEKGRDIHGNLNGLYYIVSRW